jgi:hypothetical protein
LAKKIQHSKTEQELSKNISNLENHCKDNHFDDFWQWFDSEFLSEEWLEAWVDMGRVSRDGLYNTNDYTEALLKNLIPLETKTNIANLLTVLIDVVFPYYEHEVEEAIKRQVCGFSLFVNGNVG